MDCLKHAARAALLVLLTATAHAEAPAVMPAGDAARLS